MRVTIEKRIPVAAGMAGGSADAAAALRLAMAVAPGRAEEVDAIAAGLGADVPSQLLPGVALGTGAGEMVEHFEPLAEHAFVVLPVASSRCRRRTSSVRPTGSGSPRARRGAGAALRAAGDGARRRAGGCLMS